MSLPSHFRNEVIKMKNRDYLSALFVGIDKSHAALAKYAGLTWKENQSGDYSA